MALVTVEELGQSDCIPNNFKITRGSYTEAELQLAQLRTCKRLFEQIRPCSRVWKWHNSTKCRKPISKGIIKTIAAWFLIKRANPNVNTELFYDDYKNPL